MARLHLPRPCPRTVFIVKLFSSVFELEKLTPCASFSKEVMMSRPRPNAVGARTEPPALEPNEYVGSPTLK